jgi:hypothetical protein
MNHPLYNEYVLIKMKKRKGEIEKSDICASLCACLETPEIVLSASGVAQGEGPEFEPQY